MNDHLHAAGLLELLRSGKPIAKKIWEAIPTLFAAMNEVQELVTSRLGSKTRVISSPGYARMPPALQFVYSMIILIVEGNGWRMLMAAPNRELETVNLIPLKSEVVAAWVDVSHALRGFSELADILIVLDEVPCLEITHLTASPWFGSMEPTITSSTSRTRGPNNERKNVVAAEKQVGSMAYRLTQEIGRWLFLTPRLAKVTDRTRESASPLVKQIWEFLEEQLEVAEEREMTVGRFVTAANEVTIVGFWRDHANCELRTRMSHKILERS